MSRLLAISDIHGVYDGLKKSLRKANLIDINNNWCGGDATLINLGDACDRGPDSYKVIEFLIKITKQASKAGGRVIKLRGNHESMIIDGITNRGWHQCWLENGGLQMVNSYHQVLCDEYNQVDYFCQKNPQKIYEHHKEYFDSLVDYHIENEILFVHAGVHPLGNKDDLQTREDNYTKTKHFLWIRNMFYEHKGGDFIEKNYGVKKIVVGHTPIIYVTKDELNLMRPLEKFDGKVLMIDTGSNYHNGAVTIVEFDNDRNWKVAAAF